MEIVLVADGLKLCEALAMHAVGQLYGTSIAGGLHESLFSLAGVLPHIGLAVGASF